MPYPIYLFLRSIRFLGGIIKQKGWYFYSWYQILYAHRASILLPWAGLFLQSFRTTSLALCDYFLLLYHLYPLYFWIQYHKKNPLPNAGAWGEPAFSFYQNIIDSSKHQKILPIFQLHCISVTACLQTIPLDLYDDRINSFNLCIAAGSITTKDKIEEISFCSFLFVVVFVQRPLHIHTSTSKKWTS